MKIRPWEPGAETAFRPGFPRVSRLSSRFGHSQQQDIVLLDALLAWRNLRGWHGGLRKHLGQEVRRGLYACVKACRGIRCLCAGRASEAKGILRGQLRGEN